MILKKCTKLTIDEIQKPRSGRCIVDEWWATDNDDNVLIYRNHSPQCNSNKEIALLISKKLYSGNVVQIPVAYIGVE